MLLSEHVYCVAVAFKMIAWGEQQFCIRFFIKLEHSSVGTVRMIQKAAVMGNRWLDSSRQCAPSCVTSDTVFCQNIKSPWWLYPPYSPDLAPCDFWQELKLKSPLTEERFHTISEIQENAMGQLMVIGRTVWGPKVLGRGLRHHCPVYSVSCILYLLQ